MSRPTLAALDAELSRLQQATATTTNAATAASMAMAAKRKESINQDLDRALATITQVKEEATELEAKVSKREAVLKAAKDHPLVASVGDDDRFVQELRFLRHELVKKTEQYRILMERYRRDVAVAAPRLRWCDHVLAGMSEGNANRLAELEEEAAARAEMTRKREVVALAVDENGKVMP